MLAVYIRGLQAFVYKSIHKTCKFTFTHLIIMSKLPLPNGWIEIYDPIYNHNYWVSPPRFVLSV